MNHVFRVDQCFKLFLPRPGAHAHTRTRTHTRTATGWLGLLSMVYLKKGRTGIKRKRYVDAKGASFSADSLECVADRERREERGREREIK